MTLTFATVAEQDQYDCFLVTAARIYHVMSELVYSRPAYDEIFVYVSTRVSPVMKSTTKHTSLLSDKPFVCRNYKQPNGKYMPGKFHILRSVYVFACWLS